MPDKPKVGRPTKYKESYPQELKEYFDQPLYVYRTEQKMSASGAVKDIEVREPNGMPTFEGFARKIGVLHETLVEWTKKHDAFSVAYKDCKGVQKQFILHHGMTGGYNANFTKFVAINNLGMVDKSEVKTENEHHVQAYGLAFDLTQDPDDL